jgi:hypothetical protein
MDLATQKKDLIKWIHSIEDSDVLKKLESIKSEETFDFDKEWERGVSIEDARIKSKEFIKSLFNNLLN